METFTKDELKIIYDLVKQEKLELEAITDENVDAAINKLELIAGKVEIILKENILVIVKNPGQSPKVKSVENKLEALQTEVSGYIEIVHNIHRNIVIICNEAGKLLNLEPNIIIEEINDIIMGPLIIAGIDRNGDIRGLTEKERQWGLHYLDLVNW